MGRGGENAKPDDQGPYDTSIQHSIAKAVVTGCMKGIFKNGHEIDINQSDVTKALLHESGIYERNHRHSKFKRKDLKEWVSIHHPSPSLQPVVIVKKKKSIFIFFK